MRPAAGLDGERVAVKGAVTAAQGICTWDELPRAPDEARGGRDGRARAGRRGGGRAIARPPPRTSFPAARRRYGTTGALGSSFADQSPLLKSVKRMCPFHGIAFITNEALAV